MDDVIKFGILTTLLGMGAAAVDALPTPAPAPVRGGRRNKHGKLGGGGCTPCQGRADANETLRNAAKMVGLSAARAVPKGGL